MYSGQYTTLRSSIPAYTWGSDNHFRTILLDSCTYWVRCNYRHYRKFVHIQVWCNSNRTIQEDRNKYREPNRLHHFHMIENIWEQCSQDHENQANKNMSQGLRKVVVCHKDSFRILVLYNPSHSIHLNIYIGLDRYIDLRFHKQTSMSHLLLVSRDCYDQKLPKNYLYYRVAFVDWLQYLLVSGTEEN